MCIYCGQRILAHEGTSGKKGKCPKCSHELRIPWTLKGRPGIGGTKIDTTEDSTSTDQPSDKQPAFDVVTLYGEKSGWYIPTYDEQSLFLIAITLLLIMLFNKPIKSELLLLLNRHTKNDVITSSINQILLFLATLLFYLFVIILPGFFLSFYHVFTKRQKTRFEKHLMLLFAVITNALIGIIAGFYIVRQCPLWLLIFPILNIINCIFMLIMLDAGVLNETCIIERKTTIARVITGLITSIIIFALCNYIFKLYWAVTFSICIIYATNFERALQNVFTGRQEIPNAERL
jgi:hypothetical protein